MTDIVMQLRDRACQAGLPHTADRPEDDHGHTDCWLHHQAADEIGRLQMEIVRLSTEQGESLMTIDRLRYLITAWADAEDSYDAPDFYTDNDWDYLEEKRIALRKAVGR